MVDELRNQTIVDAEAALVAVAADPHAILLIVINFAKKHIRAHLSYPPFFLFLSLSLPQYNFIYADHLFENNVLCKK